MKRLRLFIGSALTLVGVLLAMPVLVAAQAVVQGYSSTGNLQPGMIVQIDKKDTSRVIAATQDAPNDIHGVVVPQNSAPIAISEDGKQQVYIATSNKYRVLVSDQNGAIKTGDYIAVSALDGVGMKADSGQVVVLGKALNAFVGTNDTTGSTQVDAGGGRKRTVKLGYVNVALSIGHNPLQRNTTASVPGFLQRASQAIAGKQVSLLRVYFSLVVLAVTMVVVAVLLYSAIRTSIVSLGRNPLAKRQILRNLLEVFFGSMIVLIVGLFAVYLLLKL